MSRRVPGAWEGCSGCCQSCLHQQPPTEGAAISRLTLLLPRDSPMELLKAFPSGRASSVTHGHSNAQRTRSHPDGKENKVSPSCLEVPACVSLLSPSSHKASHSPSLHPFLLASPRGEQQLRASPPHPKHLAFLQQAFTPPPACQKLPETTFPKPQ